MHSLWGMVRLDSPKKVWLMDSGSDRSPGRGVAGSQVLLHGWGGVALAGEVCCHWSPGSGRRLPLGTSPASGREEGRPIVAPGSALKYLPHPPPTEDPPPSAELSRGLFEESPLYL